MSLKDTKEGCSNFIMFACLADFAAWFNCVKDSNQFSQVARQSEIPSMSYLPGTDFAENVYDDPS